MTLPRRRAMIPKRMPSGKVTRKSSDFRYGEIGFGSLPTSATKNAFTEILMIRWLALVCFAAATTLGLFSGCNRTADTTAADGAAVAPADSTSSEKTPHTHGDADLLVWESKEKIEGTELEIWFGHHGNHFHLGDEIEPAVAIMRGGNAYADAMVFNAMVNPADENKLIGQEMATVYESETADEIAHYAQGELVIPYQGTEFAIRYRVVLPDLDREITRDVKVQVSD